MASLAVVPRRRGVVATINEQTWTFGGSADGNHHFWSDDGSTCMWCQAFRSRADVRKWEKAGRPTQKCKTVAEQFAEQLTGQLAGRLQGL